MKMLGNLSRDLILSQKCLLYRVCVLSITLYGFPLWFYNKVSLAYLLKVLRNMQYRAALWILEAFCTSPLLDIETIADLITLTFSKTWWEITTSNSFASFKLHYQIVVRIKTFL